jgi:hypothetical protein
MKYVIPLNDTELQTLSDMHRYHPSMRARMRAHSLLLSHQGLSIPHIARIYQVDRRSVSSWIDRWQSWGEATRPTCEGGLDDHNLPRLRR